MWLIVTVVLAVLSLRAARWAYVAYPLFASYTCLRRPASRFSL